MTNRQCFPCTACCEGWLVTEVNGFKIEPGTPCGNCTKQGCRIYEERPENPCVSFKCGWLREPDKIPEHMRPSECGAILTLSMWGGKQIIEATPVGKTIPSDTLDWLKAHSRKYSLPLMFSEYFFEDGKFLSVKKFVYGAPSSTWDADTRIMPEDIF